MNKVWIACVILFLITGVCTLQVKSQPTLQRGCDLTESSSPSVRGLKLGMTTEQLIALFPGSAKRSDIKDALAKAKANPGDLVYLAFNPAADAEPGKFAEVDSVSAGLHNGRVTDFRVSYLGSTWTNIDEWVAKVSETFKLPASEWSVGPSETPNKVLKCSGIEIEAATLGGGSSIRVRNTEHIKAMRDNAAAEEEKKRRAFKP